MREKGNPLSDARYGAPSLLSFSLVHVCSLQFASRSRVLSEISCYMSHDHHKENKVEHVVVLVLAVKQLVIPMRIDTFFATNDMSSGLFTEHKDDISIIIPFFSVDKREMSSWDVVQ